MSIGWIMFWKAVVVAVWIAVLERYRAYKARRRVSGIVMQYDARRGCYYDPLERTEKRLKTVLIAIGGAFLLYTALVVYLIVSQ